MLIHFLLRDAVGFQQVVPALRRGLGQIQIGLGLQLRRFGLPKLLIQFRRIDGGKQLPLLSLARRYPRTIP